MQEGRVVCHGAPEGHDAYLLAEIARKRKGNVLHVVESDARLSLLVGLLAFFAPDVEVLTLPGWDCLPYDRVSPSADVVASRMETLARLASSHGKGGARIILASASAVLQRMMPQSILSGSVMKIGIGDVLDPVKLLGFFQKNGYVRAETVREAGEFAVRGSLVDIYPSGANDGVRIDLFGDEVESIRRFDPETQRASGMSGEVVLRPVSEAMLDDGAIQHFKTGYRSAFGAPREGDALFEAVGEGRRYAGFEHWLPLFYDRMDDVFAYVPDALVTLDAGTMDSASARLAQIKEHYEARQGMREVEKKAKSAPYNPLPPGAFYLSEEEWSGALAGHPVISLSPFAAPDLASAAMDGDGRTGRGFADVRSQPHVNLYETVARHATGLQKDGCKVVFAAYSAGSGERLCGLLREHGMGEAKTIAGFRAISRLEPGEPGLVILPLEHGFVSPHLAIITEQDILGDRMVRAAKPRRRADTFLQEASGLAVGDLVVHVEHGIGRYEGLEAITAFGAPHDCLKLVYDGGDRLFVPVENIEVLSRFGSSDSVAALDKLGGAAWQARRARVKKRLKDMAEELMKIAAARAVRESEPALPPEGLWQEFCARFPYSETDDQMRAIEEVVGDLASGRPMDRLVCGDVGFGKTEVALRAAFVAAMHGFQVAVVVPTTLLARQHYASFVTRFSGMPLRIAQLSRLVSAKDATATKKALAEGTVQVVIGTHALLAESIKFANLGLVIIDEEQRFGVKQKERLKRLREEVHILTLSATPIPRTMQMALAGVRELSLIATPPVDRMAVRTFVLPEDPVVLREALMREHYRGGQSFYVCPRVEDLGPLRERLADLVPELRVVVAHGQLSPTELEAHMTAFCDGEFHVLLATDIIESGLDIPRANTIIIHRADMFGLAQLYQLRGRIGRSKLRGYAYMTWPAGKPLSKNAEQRLHVLETLDSLGAGFQLASHDLDIRGAGNLLGEEQSGHIREVGIELYQHMLEEAVAEAKAYASGQESRGQESFSPQISLGIPVLIPETYIPDLSVRVSLYRRLADVQGKDGIEGFAAELIDRFGPLPMEVDNLMKVMAVKDLCRKAHVSKLDAGDRGALVAFAGDSCPYAQKLVSYLMGQAGTVRLRPDGKLVYARAFHDPGARLAGVRRILSDLVGLAS
ncbi:MAG TPA: transcription-repair coupling factor [Rhodospirillaceae bacterium]|nr:MAG: transcription-repair coupling factor [Alphaproteobacteria bacterium GWF2_58_20]HAU28764.1 transcription-repair coupling factor [Rhodospirillaceae bacterium]